MGLLYTKKRVPEVSDTRFLYIWGERGDLNPQPPGSQPGAPTN